MDDGRTIQVEVGFCSRRSRENYPVTRTIGLHYKTVRSSYYSKKGFRQSLQNRILCHTGRRFFLVTVHSSSSEKNPNRPF